jgi:2-keto-3-deoxy-L-rhamnonate aldolase RhmA
VCGRIVSEHCGSRASQLSSAGVATGNPYIAEMMGHAGFDAVVIDWQYGVGVSQESVVACIQAIGSSNAVLIVRLPGTRRSILAMEQLLCIGRQARAAVAEVLSPPRKAQGER